MGEQSFLYFAFGSNLLRERLVLANPSATFISAAKLADYQLMFFGKANSWKGGLATIQRTEGGEVWGVVWRMDTDDLTSLDQQERLYTPIEVEVRDPKGEPFCCRTYQLRLEGDWADPNPPSPHYKDVIIRGARQNQLPEHYVRGLERMVDNGYQGQLALYDAVLDLLSGGKE